mmetsp:Transcript_32057/g.69213  ORF Transcript_32057/g.69213 Transcript_32057/m.69213 type:complete len:222 (-) Transcript_32057:758-1423(-)
MPSNTHNSLHPLFLLVFQIHPIPKSSWCKLILAQKEHPQNCRNRSYCNKQRPQPVILPPKYVIVAHHQRLRTLQPLHSIVGHDGKCEHGTGRYSLLDVPVQFAEMGQRSSSHPNDEMFVGNTFNRVDEHRISLVKILGALVKGVIISPANSIFINIRSVARPLPFTLTIRLVTITIATLALLGFKPIGLPIFILQIRFPCNPRFDHGCIRNNFSVRPHDRH